MSDNVPNVPGLAGEPLQQALVRALLGLLEAAGYSGGILIALTDENELGVVSALEPSTRWAPVDLLRMVLERIEVSGTFAHRMPPMNG